MRRIGALALLVLLASAPPAAGACRAGAGTPRYTASVRADRVVIRCDRATGRRAVIRRVRPPRFINAVIALDDGRVAYTESLRPHRPAFRSRLMVRAPGARPLQVDRGRIDLVDVEDGVTLRWKDYEERRPSDLLFRDLGPLPLQDGCPVRAHYTPFAEGEGILVTRGAYVDWPDGERAVFRVCARGTDHDAIALQTFSVPRWGDVQEVTGVRFEPGVVVFRIRSDDRYSDPSEGEHRVPVTR